MANERSIEQGRRRFLGAAGSLAALSLLGGTGDQAFDQGASSSGLPAGVLAMSGVEAPPKN